MKRIKKIGAILICLLYSSPLFAQTAIGETGGTSIAPTVHTGTVIAPQAPPAAATTTAPAGPSINPAANTGQQSQNNGAGANDAAGAALIASGASMLSNPQTMPMGMALIAMGILALAQGGEDSGAADQSGNTAAVTAYGTTPGTGATTDGSSSSAATAGTATDNGLKSAFATPAGQQAVAAVAAAGGSLTPAGLTTPDGTTTPLSSFSSSSGMTAAGFDGAGAMKQVAAIEKQLGLSGASGMATAEASGGGGGTPNTFGNIEPFKLAPFKNPFDLSAAQKAQLAAGKTITLGGDPIGVKGDDIFAMIHRAYEHQTVGQNFISDDKAPVSPAASVRAPASVKRKQQ